MNNAKILVVDDESHIVELVKFNLEKEGFKVVVAYDGMEAIAAVEEESPDLMMLDIMLPHMDGLEVCRQIRQNNRYANLPIIMLTAKAEEIDTVLGLEMGADDYIKKPFSPREMVARVKARLRARRLLEATEAPGKKALIINDLTMIPDKHEAFVGDRKLDLTPKEFELLRILAYSRGKVFTREALLERVWGYEFSGDTRTVDVHIRSLRQKLGECGEMILTVRGVGYKLEG